VRLDARANVFGRHQPDVVTVGGGEHPAEVMGAATCLHSHNARRQLLRQPDHCLASHLATHDDRAGRIQPNHAADVLAKIDAQNRNRRQSHVRLLLLNRRQSYDPARRGGPFHELSTRKSKSSTRKSKFFATKSKLTIHIF
jgi:hypothetical protein